mmetsp:Transcript_9443/g.29986  ORF Transcript_9443/g.29986 Transcript_9443/m.29986 type:complete len:205 (+) Transcript_9443:319-933(+)
MRSTVTSMVRPSATAAPTRCPAPDAAHERPVSSKDMRTPLITGVASREKTAAKEKPITRSRGRETSVAAAQYRLVCVGQCTMCRLACASVPPKTRRPAAAATSESDKATMDACSASVSDWLAEQIGRKRVGHWAMIDGRGGPTNRTAAYSEPTRVARPIARDSASAMRGNGRPSTRRERSSSAHHCCHRDGDGGPAVRLERPPP